MWPFGLVRSTSSQVRMDSPVTPRWKPIVFFLCWFKRCDSWGQQCQILLSLIPSTLPLQLQHTKRMLLFISQHPCPLPKLVDETLSFYHLWGGTGTVSEGFIKPDFYGLCGRGHVTALVCVCTSLHRSYHDSSHLFPSLPFTSLQRYNKARECCKERERIVVTSQKVFTMLCFE